MRRSTGMARTTADRPSRTGNRFRAAGLLLALATAVVLILRPEDPQVPDQGQGTASTGPLGPATAPSAASGRQALPAAEGQGCYTAAPGSTFEYRLRDENAYQVQSKEAGQQQSVKVRAEAGITTTVLARRPAEILVQSQVHELRFLAENGKVIQGDAMQASYTAAAKEPVTVRLQTDGRVLGYGFSRELDGDQRNFLRGLLCVFAFTVPASAGESWQAHEADTCGEFDARYKRLPGASVRRSKLRYTVMAGEGGLPEHELTGHAKASFGDFGWIASVSIDEAMTLSLPLLDLVTAVQRRAEVTLTATGRTAVPVVRDADWDAANAPPAGHGESLGSYAAEQQRRQWQQRLLGTDLAMLLSELEQVFAVEPVDPQALDTVFQKLQWLVKLDAATALALAQQVGTRALQGNAAAAALSALAAANTEAGQKALLGIRADTTLPGDVRQAATIAMFQLARPSAEALSALANDASQAGDATGAMLVLGALAPRAEATLPGGRTALETLFALEAETARRGELPAWLLAVGNARTPETLAAATRYLDHGDASVRAAACTALQDVPGAAAATALIERGLADQDPAVRIEATQALGRRSEPTAMAALRRAAGNDADADVRYTALRELSRTAGPGSQNRRVLEQAAQSDPAQAVRDFARNLLQRA